MMLSVMQPTYLPWLGYFDLIDTADKFVFLDNVQLEKRSWQVRNKIKSAQGELMLSIAVSTPKGRSDTFICETEFKQGNHWQKKHLKSIFTSYHKSLYFGCIYPLLEDYYSQGEVNLSKFNIGLITKLCSLMGMSTPLLLASEIDGIVGVKDERLVSLCKKLNCDEYLSPIGSVSYLEKKIPGGELVKGGVELFYHQFTHPEYNQLYSGFVSHLSIIDVLFNVGPEETLKLIRSARTSPKNYRFIDA